MITTQFGAKIEIIDVNTDGTVDIYYLDTGHTRHGVEISELKGDINEIKRICTEKN